MTTHNITVCLILVAAVFVHGCAVTPSSEERAAAMMLLVDVSKRDGKALVSIARGDREGRAVSVIADLGRLPASTAAALVSFIALPESGRLAAVCIGLSSETEDVESVEYVRLLRRGFAERGIVLDVTRMDYASMRLDESEMLDLGLTLFEATAESVPIGELTVERIKVFLLDIGPTGTTGTVILGSMAVLDQRYTGRLQIGRAMPVAQCAEVIERFSMPDARAGVVLTFAGRPFGLAPRRLMKAVGAGAQVVLDRFGRKKKGAPLVLEPRPSFKWINLWIAS